MARALPKFSEKWFFLLALPVAIGIEWAFASSQDWSIYPRSEWVALVDLCVFMPLFYFFLFSRQHSLRVRMIRTLGVASLGLLAASFIVPLENQHIIAELAKIRNALLIGILIFEGLLFWKVMQALYRRGADAKKLEQDFGMPSWVAKLMVLEARFWRAFWNLIRRK